MPGIPTAVAIALRVAAADRIAEIMKPGSSRRTANYADGMPEE